MLARWLRDLIDSLLTIGVLRCMSEQRMAEKSAALSKDVSTLHTLFNGWKASEATASADDPQDAAFSDLLDKSSALFVACVSPSLSETL